MAAAAATGAVALSFPSKRLHDLEGLSGMLKGIADRIVRAYTLSA